MMETAVLLFSGPPLPVKPLTLIWSVRVVLFGVSSASMSPVKVSVAVASR
jgi:hypothetical protein